MLNIFKPSFCAIMKNDCSTYLFIYRFLYYCCCYQFYLPIIITIINVSVISYLICSDLFSEIAFARRSGTIEPAELEAWYKLKVKHQSRRQSSDLGMLAIMAYISMIRKFKIEGLSVRNRYRTDCFHIMKTVRCYAILEDFYLVKNYLLDYGSELRLSIQVEQNKQLTHERALAAKAEKQLTQLAKSDLGTSPNQVIFFEQYQH